MAKRSKKQRKKNKALLRAAYANLGNLQAEHDPNLTQYYVTSSGGFLDRALDHVDPAIAFRGPKGVGKSAILKMVELRHRTDQKRIIRIGPDELAFTVLANANVDTPLVRSAANNQWLFKSLWDYILAVRLLAVEYPRQNMLAEILTKLFKNEEQQLAMKLLTIARKETAPGKYSMTDTMLRLIKELELKVEVNAGAVGVSGGIAVRTNGSSSTPTKDSMQILSLVNHVAAALPTLINNKYHVLIDDLDLHWTNEPVQNALIAALFSAMAKLRHNENVKFVIAIREDIYKHLPIEDKDKSRDWICQVFWDRSSLKQILENRMFRLHGISSSQLWDDLMPPNAFERMLEGSLHRPRELIRQLAIAFETATQNGHSEVTESDLTEAIRRNSQEKIEELEQEIAYKYPGIDWVLKHFIGWQREFSLNDLKDVSETIALEIMENQGNLNRFKWAGAFANNPKGFAWCLIDAGVLLIKTSRQAEPQQVSDAGDVNSLDSPWFAIRPMYCPALMIVGT